MTLKLSTQTYIVICIGIQLSIVGMVFGQKLGINLPIGRQIVGFAYLTLVPGIVSLKTLTKDKFSFLEEIVYSVGISLAFVMFSGVIINYIGYYLLAIKPITLIPLTLCMLLLTTLMTIFCYYVNKKEGFLYNYKKFKLQFRSFLIFGLGILIILFSIFAGLLTVSTNIFLILLIILLSIIFLLNTFKSNSYNINVFFVFVISLALIYCMTVPTHSLPFLNLDNEFWYQSQVLSNGFWDVSLGHSINSVLSVVMLTPIYSTFLDISLIDVWKFVFPIIFSLIPVAMYIFYNYSFNKRTAFIACIFFVFSFMFFELAATIRRQMIAVLFFAIILMLLTGHEVSRKTQAGLSILFMLSIVVSHYATTYIFIAFLLLSMMISIIVTKIDLKSRPFRELKNNIKTKKLYIPSMVIIVLLIVATVSWYMYTSTGQQFFNLVKVGEHFYESLKNFFEPSARYEMTGSAFGVGFFEASFWEKVYRVVQYISEICIVVGIFSLLRQSRYAKNVPQYVIFSSVAFFILFLAMIAPFLSKMLHIHRLYFLVLVVLSPCFVIGFKAIVEFISRNLLPKVKGIKINFENLTFPLIAMFLVAYFIFHSGFAFAALGFGQQMASSGLPVSDALSYTKIDSRYANLQEIRGAKFISSHGKKVILGDIRYATNILSSWYVNEKVKSYTINFDEKIENNDFYLYLRNWNIENKELVLSSSNQIVRRKYNFDLFKGKNNIYKNGKCSIFD